MPSAHPGRARLLAFGASAALSLLLSPITAIFAVLIGAAGLCAAAPARRAQTMPVAVFAGVTAGALPYLVAGLLIR
ncbi:hypothetical protein [Actinomadura rugatobispora]|uniref:Uncharacterized protein n=1 Tax=Actinomadura rugatobispora TaxID=1994 RepID=A0ABW1A5U6_9ACTN|nr:hypothetical protein GCM10010200_107320 [Actinomadura rugatobispora]